MKVKKPIHIVPVFVFHFIPVTFSLQQLTFFTLEANARRSCMQTEYSQEIWANAHEMREKPIAVPVQ